MEIKDKQPENTCDSSTASFEGDSNVTLASNLQSANAEELIQSTELGIDRDDRDSHWRKADWWSLETCEG
jgi:hypothetical protein